jgi:hypothetical protein
VKYNRKNIDKVSGLLSEYLKARKWAGILDLYLFLSLGHHITWSIFHSAANQLIETNIVTIKRIENGRSQFVWNHWE